MDPGLELPNNGCQHSASTPLQPTGAKDKETFVVLEPDTPVPDGTADDKDSPDDVNDEEDGDVKVQRSSLVGRMVVQLQRAVRKAMDLINDRFGGHFFSLICLLLYFAYFSYAMYYRFGDEGSVRLLWCTVLGVVIACRHAVWRVLRRTSVVTWCTGPKPPATARRIHTLRFFTRWLLNGGVGAFMGYIIVDVAIKDPEKLRSLPGILVFLLICFLFSTHPSKVNWHTIYWSVGLQFILAVLVMRWQGGKDVMLWIQTRLDNFFDNADPSARLLFGDSYKDHNFIFGVVPILFLSNSVLSMLYYVGAIQFLIRSLGNAMRLILGTSAVESMGVAAAIFLDGCTSLLCVRPYLSRLTTSEFFTLTASCLSSIGGTYLALMLMFGIPVELLLPAMVISAPATFAITKLLVPETRRPRSMAVEDEALNEQQYLSLLDAAQAGAVGMISVAANFMVTAYSFFALLTWLNTVLTWCGDRVGVRQLTLEMILSYLFFPVAYLMGVELRDCRNVAALMGIRLTSASLFSMIKLQELAGNRMKFQEYSLLPNATVSHLGDHIVLDQWNVTLVDGYISRRSEHIATYALCGFSSLMSFFVNFSIMNILVPQRRSWLIHNSMSLLLAGNLANFMVGCFAVRSHGDEDLKGGHTDMQSDEGQLYQDTDGWRRSSVGSRCEQSQVLQQVMEANKEADGPWDFVLRVTGILSSTVVMTMLLFVTLAVPVVMITMGVKYLDDCPLEKRIPIYLLVGGCFLALKLLGMLWKNLLLRRYDNMDAFYDSADSELLFTSRTFLMMDWILSAFLLAWHVVGACWVFTLWLPPFLPHLHRPSDYCGRSVYLTAVVEILATGGLLLLALLLCAALALCYKYTTVFEQ